MKWLQWQRGRQGTGYWKMLLLQFWFLDLYLLSYYPEQWLPEHSDLVPGKRHLRCNLILRPAKRGGVFHCKDGTIWETNRLKIFYSDRPHSMTPIKRGIRLVLSLGIIFQVGDK